MEKAFLLKVLTVSCCLFGAAWAASLPVEDNSAFFVTCQYVEFMLGDVPSPWNCSQYYTCVNSENPNQPTVPVVRGCPVNLYFDFRSCNCEHTMDGCYDLAQHGPHEFFGCTKPLGSEPEPEILPEPEVPEVTDDPV